MRVIFAGPSFGRDIATLQTTYPSIEFRAPAARGDILQAVEDGARAIGIVDGYFGEMPSVWHKEILFALQQNVIVAGGASMGALRAAESSARRPGASFLRAYLPEGSRALRIRQ
jgi:hypothetical protein